MADGVLGRIICRKRREVAARLGGSVPEAEPTRRSLADALRRPGARFIMEVKRASPSGHRSPHSVETAARAYAPVADAISVLTDGADFGGKLEDIAAVRRHFDGPILAKDFIVDPRQVAEARRHGADAVLAMLSVLDDAAAADVLGEAKRLNMDAIVEVHDAAEMRRAIALGAAIIGINNRNLGTLGIDLDVTRRLAPMAPPATLVIAESGIGSRADVLSLASHVDGFLVGSALMAADDVVLAARALVHGRVKICGLTREADVAAAAAAGATHAGFVLVPGTPRHLRLEACRALANQAAGLGLKRVGIFRDAEAAAVVRAAEQLGLDAVQLHGREPDADLARIRTALSNAVEVWAVSPVGDKVDAPPRRADRIIFDTAIDGRCGATGVAFEWERVRKHPALADGIIAGGIGPENAAGAASVGAYAIDVGSGVEAAPGIKDATRLRALFSALRAPKRSLEPACA